MEAQPATNMLQKEVVSHDGHDLGIIEDFTFNSRTGRLEAIQVEYSQKVSDSYRRKYFDKTNKAEFDIDKVESVNDRVVLRL